MYSNIDKLYYIIRKAKSSNTSTELRSIENELDTLKNIPVNIRYITKYDDIKYRLRRLGIYE